MKNIIKFGIGGIPGTGLNYAILYFSSRSLEVKGLTLIIIAALAFLLKEIINFAIHKWWTFKVLDVGEIKKEIISYIGIVTLITFANTVLFYFLVKITGYSPVVSQIILNLSFFVVNFPATKKIFNKNLIKKEPDANQ